jgi:hypothetical protein
MEIISEFDTGDAIVRIDRFDMPLHNAAHELLAALENLTVLFDRIDRSGATNKAAYNDAIAAITKAKGN